MAFRISQATGSPVAHLCRFTLLLLVFAPLSLLAQVAPDAGTILREQNQQPPVLTPSPATQPLIETPLVDSGSEVDDGPTMRVEGFRLSGNSLIPTSELIAQLDTFVGEELTFTEIQTLGLLLTAYYVEQGYLARALLPPQDIVDGIVEYQVEEGIRGDLNIATESDRIQAERLSAFVDARLSQGQPLNLALLGEAMNVLNEQPGVAVSLSLEPGAEGREINLNLSAADTPEFSYTLGTNNYSTKATGDAQLSLGITANNLSGRFDSLSLNFNGSDGTTFAQIGYSVALGDRGLRLATYASALDYELVQSDFDALQAEGTARTLGASLSYPLSRQVVGGSDLSFGVERKQLKDNTVAGETGDRRVQTITLGWSRYAILPEGWYQGVLNTSATLTAGDAKQDNTAALAADQAFRQTNGSFAKLDLALSHFRPIGDSWSLSSLVRGQLANKNLDSSARMSLGGPSAIRGFAVSEATGDEGLITSVSLDRTLSNSVSVGGFVDWGRIHISKKGALPGDTIPNWYNLSATGINVNAQWGSHTSLSFVVAHPLTNNPGADFNGLDVDGEKSGTRVWLNFGAQF